MAEIQGFDNNIIDNRLNLDFFCLNALFFSQKLRPYLRSKNTGIYFIPYKTIQDITKCFRRKILFNLCPNCTLHMVLQRY